MYTAPSPAPLAGLTVNYTATSTDNSSISASGSIQVLGVTVSLDVTSANVIATGTQQFVAAVTNDPTNSGVTWSVSCSPAPCGTVPSGPTPSGTPIIYTAPSTPPPSDLSVTLTATAVAYNGAIATASITVPAITVSVSPGSALMPLNSSVQFSATALYDDGSTSNVTGASTFSSSNPMVAAISAGGPGRGQATGLAAGTSSIGVKGSE